MQLDDFIESVLTQIASGIANANAKLIGSNEKNWSIAFYYATGE